MLQVISLSTEDKYAGMHLDQSLMPVAQQLAVQFEGPWLLLQIFAHRMRVVNFQALGRRGQDPLRRRLVLFWKNVDGQSFRKSPTFHALTGRLL